MKDALGQHQSILVLGGTSEIGLAITELLATRHANRVILAGRNMAALEEAAVGLRGKTNATVSTMAWDARDYSGTDSAVGEAFAKEGRIDMVLVAVGLLGDQAKDEVDLDRGSEVMSVNYVGAATACLAATKRLKEQGQGTLVVLSSVAAVRVRASNFIYGSSKAALDGFCQGLADSLEGSGVEVVIVRPGFVTTKMTAGMKVPPLSTGADAVAKATVAGLARRSAVVWSPPAIRWVSMVLRSLPRPIFRRLPF